MQSRSYLHRDMTPADAAQDGATQEDEHDTPALFIQNCLMHSPAFVPALVVQQAAPGAHSYLLFL